MGKVRLGPEFVFEKMDESHVFFKCDAAKPQVFSLTQVCMFQSGICELQEDHPFNKYFRGYILLTRC